MILTQGEKNVAGLLYLLMRDHVAVGVINGIVKDLLADSRESIYSDKILYAKAESVASMLESGEYKVRGLVVIVSEKSEAKE